MKAFAALSALLLSVVSATPIDSRQTEQPTSVSISGFTAQTTPNGPGASLSFTANIPGVVTTTCTYTDQTSGDRLPEIPWTKCKNAAVEFQFKQTSTPVFPLSPYLFAVLYSSRVSGGIEWQVSEFPTQQDGETVEQKFVGNPNFDVELR